MNRAEILIDMGDHYHADPQGRRGMVMWSPKHWNPDTQQMEEKPGEARPVCVYFVENGDAKYCAVGRLVREEYLQWIKGVDGSVEDLITQFWQENYRGDELEDYEDPEYAEMREHEEYYMDQLLKPEYSGMPTRFWQSLQELHDTDSHWGDNGLTEAGFIAFEEFINANIPEPLQYTQAIEWLKELRNV